MDTKNIQCLLNLEPMEPENFYEQDIDMRYCQASQNDTSRLYRQNKYSNKQNSTSQNDNSFRNRGSEPPKQGQFRLEFQRGGAEIEFERLQNLNKNDQRRPGADYDKKPKDGMWDDDFTSKKFELGRVIERDPTKELIKDLIKLDIQ